MNEYTKIGFTSTVHIMWKCFSYIKEARRKYIVGVLLSFAELGAVFLLPYSISLIMSLVVEGFDRQLILRLSVLFASFIILTPLICMGDYWRMTASYQGIIHLKKTLFKKIQRFPAEIYDTTEKGELIGRQNLDSEMAINIYRGMFTQLFSFIVFQSVGLVILAGFGWELVLFSLCILFISVGFTVFMNPIVRALEHTTNKNYASLISQTDEAIAEMSAVKIYSMHKYLTERFLSAAKIVCYSKMKFRFINGTSYAIVDFLNFIVQPASFLFVLHFSTRNEISIPQAVYIAMVMIIMGQGTKNLNAFIQSSQRCLVAAQRVFSLLALPVEEVDSGDSVKEDISNSREDHSVGLDNVGFTYGRDWALQDINLNIENGEIIALVGSSGSGKSTLIKLLLSLYNTTCGNITFFGKAVRKFSIRQTRAFTSYVSQDSAMFDGTITENIALGEENYDMQRVIKAAEKAEIDSYIKLLPQGYDTVLEQKGFNVSGGEKQRLALARAFYKNAPIYLLDEATASLDVNTEQKILQNIRDMSGDKTIILITHRLRTIAIADRIAYMENGEITELGTHDELMKRKGGYYQLYLEMERSMQKIEGG